MMQWKRKKKCINKNELCCVLLHDWLLIAFKFLPSSCINSFKNLIIVTIFFVSNNKVFKSCIMLK